MAGKKGQKKRFWSDEEKRLICAQTRAPDVSVAQVARRYSMNANMIFKWLKDERYAPIQAGDFEVADDVATFVPVEIENLPSAHVIPTVPFSSADLAETVSANRVDITLSDGRRILVEGTTVLSSILVLVKGLMS